MNTKWFIGIIVSILVQNISFAQTIMKPLGAQYGAVGTYSQSFTDVYAVQHNAAALPGLESSAVSAYSEKRFNLKELSFYNLVAAIPVSEFDAFGVSASYLGHAESNQTFLSLGYGRKLSDKIQVGTAFHYNRLGQNKFYGSAGYITASVGAIMHVTDKVHVGINAYNPIQATYGTGSFKEKTNAQYTFGIGYDAGKNLHLGAALVTEQNNGLSVNLSLQYNLIDRLFLRGGINTQTTSYFASLGFLLSDFRIDLATSYHPQLGLTPGVLLMYQFKKSKKVIANP